MSSGVSPDSLAKRQGNTRRRHGKNKQRSDTKRQLEEETGRQHGVKLRMTDEMRSVQQGELQWPSNSTEPKQRMVGETLKDHLCSPRKQN